MVGDGESAMKERWPATVNGNTGKNGYDVKNGDCDCESRAMVGEGFC